MSVTLCMVACLVLVGCEHAPMIDLGPQLDADGVRRSVALDTPILQHLKTRQLSPDAITWYDGRNDRSLSVSSGYDLPTLQASSTLTRDRQYISGGHVRDSFSSTTYRSEYRRSVR